MSDQICGVVCEIKGEPLACGYPTGHDSAHAWAPFTEYEVKPPPAPFKRYTGSYL